jgi:hypothetical protein
MTIRSAVTGGDPPRMSTGTIPGIGAPVEHAGNPQLVRGYVVSVDHWTFLAEVRTGPLAKIGIGPIVAYPACTLKERN